jgi:hypothetical protein
MSVIKDLHKITTDGGLSFSEKVARLLGPVDLCCIYFTQQYMGSHIIENASDTMLA